MGKIKIYKTLTLLLAMACFGSCDNNEIKDIPKVQEKLVLTATTNEITLTEENLDDVLVTFEWTPAREMSNDYIITYTTKLDIMGNNFGTSTMIYIDEEYGVYSKSYRGSQIAFWAQEKWGVGVNTPYTLQFRVVAQWEGGPTFEAPEVRQVEVKVNPIYVVIPEPFEVDKVFIEGDAVGSTIEMQKTLENDKLFAWMGNLSAGELQIPAEFQGTTNYIYPEGFDGTLADGEKVNVEMWASPTSWNITDPGEYRIVVDALHRTVAIYSPEKALQPKVVEWPLNGIMQTTVIEDLWYFGEPDNWSWKGGNFTQSIADPQVFIFSGKSISGRTKFGVYPHDQSYVFAASNNGDVAVTHGVTQEIFGGYGGNANTGDNPRNSYFRLPSATNFIVLDIRNMELTAYSR